MEKKKQEIGNSNIVNDSKMIKSEVRKREFSELAGN